MHNAPSVTYPVGRSRFSAGLMAIVWCAGLAATGAWALQAGETGWRLGLMVAVVLLSGGWALHAHHTAPAGLLRWDGQAWSWRGPAPQDEAGQPVVALDLQRWLLLRWTGGRHSRWFWLARASAPAQWRALRRAVHARARVAGSASQDSRDGGELAP
ncbi:MAG: hypothetical protein KF796_08000 [Ramlibacter sp.]|nr:hypothetical protein [Ramlibacter sp.]